MIIAHTTNVIGLLLLRKMQHALSCGTTHHPDLWATARGERIGADVDDQQETHSSPSEIVKKLVCFGWLAGWLAG